MLMEDILLGEAVLLWVFNSGRQLIIIQLSYKPIVIRRAGFPSNSFHIFESR